MMKTLKRALLAIIGAGALSWAADVPQNQPVGPFSGLYTNVSPEAVPAANCIDCLNVDIGFGGKSVKKRQGYGTDATLVASTVAVKNVYKFSDASGNDVRLAFNDNRISASINGASWSVIIATGTIGATWECTDYLGFAYCVSSAFDNPIKTNGTAAGTTGVGGTNAVPAGTCIASTADRLLVAGTSANPSRISYSASASFTDFTLGAQNSSSSFEDITAPGSKITHLAYRYGRWLWWKEQSFGFLVGTGQQDLNSVTVSNTIGTLDNTDVFDQGITYFRGSDAQIYAYDGSVLRPASIDTAPTMRTANRRKANSWTQSSQSEFATGAVTFNGPPVGVSTAIASGSIYPSSITITDTNSADFAQGTMTTTIDSVTVSGALTLKNYVAEQFSSGLGSFSDGGCAVTAISDGNGHVRGNNGSISGTACVTLSTTVVSGGSVVQIDGHKVSTGDGIGVGICNGNTGAGYYAVYNFQTSNTDTAQIYKVTNCTTALTAGTLLCNSGLLTTQTDVTLTLNRDASSNFTLYVNGLSTCTASDSTTTSFTNVKGYTSNNVFGTDTWIDNIYDSARTGNFNSRAFDTRFSTPIYGTFTSGTASTGTWSYATRCSTDPVTSYTTDSSISTGSAITGCTYKRYLVYSTTITATASASSLPQITDVTAIAASTGTYYSAVNNANLLSSWNSLNVTDATNGNSSITYFTRASTNSFTVLSSTPAWVAQTKNATVSASTGTYMQLRADFLITAATETPHLDDFQFNWFEGTAADKMYGIAFDNAVWFSLSLGTSSTTNNRILKYDLLNRTWLPYNIPANGFLVYNNGLYFGDPSAGKIYQFGNNVKSDNGSAINAYWKSKPFYADNPFEDHDMRSDSWYIASASGTVLTVTYTLNQSSDVARTINLFDPRRGSIQTNWNFPLGSVAQSFNVKFGDNSSNSPWEVFGGVLTVMPRPWKVYP